MAYLVGYCEAHKNDPPEYLACVGDCPACDVAHHALMLKRRELADHLEEHARDLVLRLDEHKAEAQKSEYMQPPGHAPLPVLAAANAVLAAETLRKLPTHPAFRKNGS